MDTFDKCVNIGAKFVGDSSNNSSNDIQKYMTSLCLENSMLKSQKTYNGYFWSMDYSFYTNRIFIGFIILLCIIVWYLNYKLTYPEFTSKMTNKVLDKTEKIVDKIGLINSNKLDSLNDDVVKDKYGIE